MSLKLSEIFYSLQGEGPAMGHPSVFVRTAGCNLNCGQEPGAEWKCDTWNIMRATKMEVEADSLVDFITAKIPAINDNPTIRIVFTGGEPFLQAEDLLTAIKRIKKEYLFASSRIDFETNGTMYNDAVREILNITNGYVMISPKLSNSHIPESKRFKVDYLKNILANADRAYLKLVVSSEKDVQEVLGSYIPLLRDVFGWYEWSRRIYLMPAMEDVPSMEIKQLVWKTCMDLQIPMAMRAQIDTFGRKTGV